MAMRRMPKPTRDPESVDYESLCFSELLAIARFNELPGASRAVPRKVLIHSLRTLQPIEVEDPMDKIRRRLHQWFKRFWPKLAMQVPLQRPKDAELFSDMEAAKYWVKNRDKIT